MVKIALKKVNHHVLIESDWGGGIFDWMVREDSLMYLNHFLLWKMIIVTPTR